MQFEEDKRYQKLGEKIGFIFGYFLFTTMLFFILLLSKKLPSSWSYFHIIGITILINIFGFLIKEFTGGKSELKSIFSRL